MLKTILEQYRNGERGLPTYDELAAIVGGDHDGHAQINGGACRAQAEAQPVAWVRYCSDSTFEDPIMDTDIRMAGARRTSGAWTPLYAHPSAEARSVGLGRKESLDTAEMLEMRITEAMTRLDEAKAEVKELRLALAIARDQMRFMANWFRHSSPAEHRFAESAITIVNAVLERGEPK
ncbi:hypothetical protein KMC49_gp41 [Ralstonia phage Firinga]|uniref:Uncharacterized protein n=2 Tax=Firingavirus firinga TaxID=2846043 RepID=A0A7G5B9Y6_9CAUD|nr:hypothetical protein KMC49_gp41 [Ralstonia phage Firinga]QMV33109.1 hypothetical protein 18C_00041 [Ralstonia phage Firinga]QMV33348.1 hypothetical protein 12C_00038 [Ralstonia phage Hennie]